MRVKITDTFHRHRLATFKRDHLSIEDLVASLRKNPLIRLDSIIYKYKGDIRHVAIRGIVFFVNNNELIPVYFVKKSDKLRGANLVLDHELKKILSLTAQKYEQDFLEGKYTVHEI